VKRAIEIRDKRQPIVLLRAFSDDERVIGLTGPGPLTRDLTLEEVLHQLFRPFGPFVAIGRPGEKSPPLGAARFWVSNGSWQDAADILIREARAIVMVMSGVVEGQGLSWEVNRIQELGCLEKLILVMPPVNERHGKLLWESFDELLGGRLSAYPPGVLFAGPVTDKGCPVVCSPTQTRTVDGE
jgi:hypothetical protein